MSRAIVDSCDGWLVAAAEHQKRTGTAKREQLDEEEDGEDRLECLSSALKRPTKLTEKNGRHIAAHRLEIRGRQIIRAPIDLKFCGFCRLREPLHRWQQWQLQFWEVEQGPPFLLLAGRDRNKHR